MVESTANYTLKRAARTLGVHEQTLRNWEERGLIAWCGCRAATTAACRRPK